MIKEKMQFTEKNFKKLNLEVFIKYKMLIRIFLNVSVVEDAYRYTFNLAEDLKIYTKRCLKSESWRLTNLGQR